MFKTSQQEAFCDASKALKSVFGRDSAPDPAGWSWNLTLSARRMIDMYHLGRGSADPEYM